MSGETRKIRAERANRRGPSRRGRRRRRWMAVAAATVLVAAAAALGGSWLGSPRAGTGRAVEVLWRPGLSAGEGASLLAAAGVIESASAFHVLLVVVSPLLQPAPGPHLFMDDLTPAEVLRRLVRLTSRARVRAVIPEGFNRFQIAERLESLRVCSAASFGAATTDPDLLARLEIPGDSAEGYLFPATYDLFRDGDPGALVTQLVSETRKRLEAVRLRYPARFAELEATLGFHDRELLTFASIVEKEAARDDEQPLIASVFFNRLTSPDFRPARSLQSDPTAAYGCLVARELESCRGYAGRVLPAMLRDPGNAYNTYRHPGLPPGPIANPGVHAVEAVLAPKASDYLFFVASGDGRHAFSRTLEEHETNIHAPRK